MLFDLNTSYVEVKQRKISGTLTRNQNLNTSYVEVKLVGCSIKIHVFVYLNTSYVEVKPKEIKELMKDTNVFKYILC